MNAEARCPRQRSFAWATARTCFRDQENCTFQWNLGAACDNFFRQLFLVAGLLFTKARCGQAVFPASSKPVRRGAARHSTGAQQSNALFSRPRCTLGLGGPCAVHAVVVHVRPLSARRPGARDASARQPTSRVLAHPCLTAVRIYYRQPPRGPAPDLFAAKR